MVRSPVLQGAAGALPRAALPQPCHAPRALPARALPASAPQRKSFDREKPPGQKAGWDLGTLSRARENPLDRQREERQVLPAAALSLGSQAGVAFRVPFLFPDGKNKLVAGAA